MAGVSQLARIWCFLPRMVEERNVQELQGGSVPSVEAPQDAVGGQGGILNLRPRSWRCFKESKDWLWQQSTCVYICTADSEQHSKLAQVGHRVIGL
jgi:hypothetical protein